MPTSPTPTPTPVVTGYTNQDAGGCNCCGMCIACLGCALPGSDLTVSGPSTASASLIFQRYPGYCFWSTGCFRANLANTLWQAFNLMCNPTCTYIRVGFFGNSSCSGTESGYSEWNCPSDCLDTNSHGGGITSFTCSPLSITYEDGGLTWVITL
jgi:hypothetical protein